MKGLWLCKLFGIHKWEFIRSLGWLGFTRCYKCKRCNKELILIDPERWDS